MTSTTTSTYPSSDICRLRLAAAQICIEQNPIECSCFTTGQRSDFLGPYSAAVQSAMGRGSMIPKTSKFCDRIQNAVCHHFAKSTGCCCTVETDMYQQCVVSGEIEAKFHQQCPSRTCLNRPGGKFVQGGYFADNSHFYGAIVASTVLFLGATICGCWYWSRKRSISDKDKVGIL